MTQKEFFQKVVEANINEEMTAYAAGAIEKITERNEKRKTTPTKSQKENEVFKAQIIEFLSDKEGYTLCSEIAAHFEVKPQKASGVLVRMVEDGTVESTEVKVPKQGKRKGYRLVTAQSKCRGAIAPLKFKINLDFTSLKIS